MLAPFLLYLGLGVNGLQQQQQQRQQAAGQAAAAAATVSAPAAPRASASLAAAGTGVQAGGSSKPAKLKLNLHGGPSGSFKPKIKLKGQILPQAQPPPQDMGSQIQGHPPGADSQGAARHEGAAAAGPHNPAGSKPKLKLVMPKGFMRSNTGGTQGPTQQQQQHPGGQHVPQQQQHAAQQQRHAQLPPPAPLQHQHSLPESKVCGWSVHQGWPQ